MPSDLCHDETLLSHCSISAFSTIRQAGDSDDSDFAIGIGCHGQNTPTAWGAGMNDCVSRVCFFSHSVRACFCLRLVRVGFSRSVRVVFFGTSDGMKKECVKITPKTTQGGLSIPQAPRRRQSRLQKQPKPSLNHRIYKIFKITRNQNSLIFNMFIFDFRSIAWAPGPSACSRSS